MPKIGILGAVLCAALVLPALAAEQREPPSCSAIAFRPVPSGQSDGVQDAGMYKSRFGRMEVKANFKDGAAQGYFVEIDGKKLATVSAADLPKEVAACAKVKRLSAPAKPEDPCTGDKLTVLTSHSGEKKYFLLYGHSGGAWHFCSAGSV